MITSSTTTSSSSANQNINHHFHSAVYLPKDIMIRLYHFLSNQINYHFILLYGIQNATYKNRNYKILNFKIIYSENDFLFNLQQEFDNLKNENLNKDLKNENLKNEISLLGFIPNSLQNNKFTIMKNSFQYFHYYLLQNILPNLENVDIQLLRTYLEKYFGIFINIEIQNNIYNNENFIQLFKNNFNIYFPYLSDNYIQTIYGNFLLKNFKYENFNLNYRKDINLIFLNENFDFCKDFCNFCNENNNPIEKCLNDLFLKNDTIPYLENFIGNQFLELENLISKFSELEKENEILERNLKEL
ncbi:hypothetical protein ABK040_001030 [Willaertia magna]